MTTATSVAEKARGLTDPDATALAAAPEKPEDLRTVEQVDWQGLITAALGADTSIDLPLPQLLLRIGAALAGLTENGEHLKHFVNSQGDELQDAMESVDERLKKRNDRRMQTEGRLAKLEVLAEGRLGKLEARVEQLEAALTAPADASTVHDLNPSATTSSTR